MGTAFVLADDCIWLWHLTDKQLLTHFNFHFPQKLQWQQCILQPEMSFAPLFTLQRKQQLQELFLLQLQNWVMVAHIAGKMRRVENLPLPRSQHKSHSQLPCGISPQSMHRENHPKWKLCRIRNVETALYAIGQTVVLPGPNHHDPRLKPSGKLMIVLQTSVPALWKKKTPPYLCRTTTCPAHEICSESFAISR